MTNLYFTNCQRHPGRAGQTSTGEKVMPSAKDLVENRHVDEDNLNEWNAQGYSDVDLLEAMLELGHVIGMTEDGKWEWWPEK